MKFEILGWECAGLRCPDIKLSLKHGKSISPIVLIQMPNGTGKTTTLDLLRVALTGDGRFWDAEIVKDLRRPGSNNPTGKFELQLAVDDDPLTICLNINLVDGRIEYETTSPSTGGLVFEWKPPVEIRRFLREKFINLFIFNGELAKDLMNSDESAAEESIDALCQLDLLDTIQLQVNEHWERETKKGIPKSKKGQNAAINLMKALEQKLRKQKKILKDAKSKIGKLADEIEKKDKKLESSLSGHQYKNKEVIEARNIENEHRLGVSTLSIELMSNLRQPEKLHHFFGAGLNKLKKDLDVLKLPESTSSQFFKELKQEPICVCGRPLDDECRKAIDQHAARYLGGEISGFLNSLKRDIEKFVGTPDPSEKPAVIQIGDSLGEAADNWHTARTLREKLENELLAGGGKEVKKLAERLAILKDEKDILEEACEDIEDLNFTERDTKDLPESIPVLEKELRDVRGKVAEIGGTIKLGEKTKIISEIITRSKFLARDKIRNSIRDDCNKRLKKILASDPIEIDDIGQSISLRGQRGASEGQILSVGYTFLTSVLDRGKHIFPLVVDSPAIPIDINVRRQVGELIPQLCHQFIGFTISSETAGFVRALHAASKGKIKYLTVFRRTEGTKGREKMLPKKSVVLTNTGVVVEAQKYFMDFDIEEEEDF